MKQRLNDKYKYIFEAALLEEIAQIGQYRKVKKGFSMIDIGQPLQFMPLILNGALKVMGEDDKGKEYLLYYLEVGDSCAMTMTCCMGNKRSKIKAIAEEDLEMITVPIQKMEEWLIQYKSWRVFVFESYESRMKEMLETIDILAFHGMEDRIYKYLKDRAMVLRSPNLEITHYQIANDLSTSRVVVSRLMKKLVVSGKIRSNRNLVEIVELSANR